MARTKVFISYSHADRRFLDRLRVFLKPLERDGRVDWWDDTRLTAGSKWREEIKTAVESARVAVLLISADFFASDFIHKNELPPLLEAAARDEAVLLSVVLQPVDFSNSNLSEIQTVNDPSRPLGKLRTRAERDEVWVQVTKAIEAALSSAGPAEATGQDMSPVPSPSMPTPAPEPASKRRQKKGPLKGAHTPPPSREEPEVGTIKPVTPARVFVPALLRPDPLGTSPRRQRSFLQTVWWRAIELWDEFKSCRLGLLSIAIGSFFFLYLGQGVEVLRVVAEGNAGDQWYAPRVFGFFAALVLWGICNWYSARALFYFDFPGVRRRLPSTASWDATIDALQSLLPRLLGVAPFLVIGLGFLGAARAYDSSSPVIFWLRLFALVCLVLAIVFYGLLILRRRWVGKMPARELESLGQLDRGRMIELASIG
ncbi:MAG: hypothetical protein DME97_06405 [Verrucomicrobia bacterium]|nr:MAG: hypothetical protein DME97_06405 [Verrucomicrobiota bacterium]